MTELTCICCPMGCTITVEKKGEEFIVSGNGCPRGKKYAVEELTAPTRTVTSSVKVNGGDCLMASVKTDKPVKKSELFDLMKKINGKIVDAPIKTGQIIVENITDGVNLIATCGIE